MSEFKQRFVTEKTDTREVTVFTQHDNTSFNVYTSCRCLNIRKEC